MIAYVTRHVTPARLAAGCTAVVFVAAFAISWESLRVLALSAGIRPLLAPLYPLTIDGVMSTATVAAVALRSAPLRKRLYTWALITAGIAVSVLGNAVHSQALGGVLVLPWWAAAAASAVLALSLAASLHLLVIVLRHARHSEDIEASTEAVTPVDIPVDISEPVKALPVSLNGRPRNRTSRRASTRTSGDVSSASGAIWRRADGGHGESAPKAFSAPCSAALASGGDGHRLRVREVLRRSQRSQDLPFADIVPIGVGEPRTLHEVLLGQRHVPGPVAFAIIFSLGLVPASLFMLGFGIYRIVGGLGGGTGEVVGALCMLGLAIASAALIALGWRSFQDRRRSSPP